MAEMRKVVADIIFESGFGRNQIAAHIQLSEPDYSSYCAYQSLDTLPYRILRPSECLREAARLFFVANYRHVLDGKVHLNAAQLMGIQSLTGLNRSQFSQALGLDKGSLSNILSGRRRMQRSTQLLAMERLGMELVRKGAVKGFLLQSLPQSSDPVLLQLIEQLRYGTP